MEQRGGERSNEIAPWLREAVLSTLAAETSKPVHDPKTDLWLVVRVTGRRADKFDARSVPPMPWLVAHAATALPSPDALRTDAMLRRRSALNRTFTVDQLQARLAANEITPADLDRQLSSGSTLLLRALAGHDEAMAGALLAAGASIDACGASDCPLGFAALRQDHASLRWLLAHGARADRAPARPGALPPLVISAMLADKESAQLLIDARVDPLLSVDESVFGQSIKHSLGYYVPGNQPEFLAWIYAQVERADERSGRYRWTAWIEQGGVRHPIVDGATIALRAQPFRIVMKTPEDTPFRILASEDPVFIAETRSAVERRAMLSPFRVGAVGPDSHFLDIGEFVTRNAAREFDGSSIELAWRADPKSGTGTERVGDKRGNHEDVHEITEFITPSGTIATKDFADHTIHALVGPLPRHGVGSDLYKPARFDIVLR